MFDYSKLLLPLAHQANLPILSQKCEERRKRELEDIGIEQEKVKLYSLNKSLLFTIYFCKAMNFCVKSTTLVIML